MARTEEKKRTLSITGFPAQPRPTLKQATLASWTRYKEQVVAVVQDEVTALPF